MSNDEIHEKTISVLTFINSIQEHAAGLLYAKDSESATFHIFWVKWYFERLKESINILDDVVF